MSSCHSSSDKDLHGGVFNAVVCWLSTVWCKPCRSALKACTKCRRLRSAVGMPLLKALPALLPATQVCYRSTALHEGLGGSVLAQVLAFYCMRMLLPLSSSTSAQCTKLSVLGGLVQSSISGPDLHF
jgi:hypothetical protein